MYYEQLAYVVHFIVSSRVIQIRWVRKLSMYIVQRSFDLSLIKRAQEKNAFVG